MPDQKGPHLMVELEVKNKEGVVLHQTKEKAHSWLTNYYAWLTALMNLGTSQTVKSDTGIDHVIGGGFDTFNWDAYSGAKTYIAIGKSSEAFNKDVPFLQNFFAKAAVASISFDSSTKKVILETSITCASAVTIRETGVMFYHVKNGFGIVFDFYIERTVLASAVAIPTGGSVAVKYTITH